MPTSAFSADGNMTARTIEGDLDMRTHSLSYTQSPLEIFWEKVELLVARSPFGSASLVLSLRIGLGVLLVLLLALLIFNVMSTFPLFALVPVCLMIIALFGLYATFRPTKFFKKVSFILNSAALIFSSFALTITVNWYAFYKCPNLRDAHWRIGLLIFQSCGYNLMNVIILVAVLLCQAYVVRNNMTFLIKKPGQDVRDPQSTGNMMNRARDSRAWATSTSTANLNAAPPTPPSRTPHGPPPPPPSSSPLKSRSQSTAQDKNNTHVALARIPSRPVINRRGSRQFTDIDAELETAQLKRFYPQMIVIYTIFVGVVIAAVYIGWSPGVDLINLVPYGCACLVVLETGRLFLSGDASSVVPLFLNLVPMGILVAISREAHTLVAVMFFFSTFIIQLQFAIIAQRHKKTIAKPVLIYVCLSVAIYIASVAFIQSFYSDAIGTDQFRGAILLTPVDWSREITIAIALMCCGLLFTEFAHVFSSSLYTHINSIKMLAAQNINLKQALRKAKDLLKSNQGPAAQRNLDAPLSKALTILQDLMNSGIPEPVRILIDEALAQLNSENIFRPDLSKEDMRLLHPELAMSYVVQKVTDDLSTNGPRRLSASPSVDRHASGPHSLERAAASVDLKDSSGMNVETRNDEVIMESVAEMITDWNCDCFKINQITNNHPLLYTVSLLLHVEGLVDKFGMNDITLRRFLLQIEKGYLSNPYHNAIHATDITVTFYNFLLQGLKERLSKLEMLSSIIACVVHDYRHPGYTNAFQVATDSDMALQFNDRAVLENYHLVAFFTLLRLPELNIFKGLTKEQRRESRRIIIAMVLATDLSEHFNILNKFKAKVETNSLDLTAEADRSLMLQTAIKCCDVSNPAKSIELARLWSACVVTEFRRQGDAEKRLGLTLSPFMDRSKEGELQKCQESFIDFLCAPLFDVWSDFMGTTLYPLAIAETRGYWVTLTEQDVVDLLKSTCGMIGIDWTTGFPMGQSSVSDPAIYDSGGLSPLYTMRRLGASPSMGDTDKVGGSLEIIGGGIDGDEHTLVVPSIPGTVLVESMSGEGE